MTTKETAQYQVLNVMAGAGFPPGSFNRAIIDAAMRADSKNTELLRLGFPELVGAVRAWQAGENKEEYPIITDFITNKEQR